VGDADLVVLLVNPTAGGGAAAGIARQAVHTFAGLGLEAVTVSPASAGAAGAAVAETLAGLAGKDRRPRGLVAVGGDGTVRLAAGIAAGAGLPLGIIPAGTGNGAAYSLGLPLDAWAACRVVARGRPEPCDLGRMEFGLETSLGPASERLPVTFLNVAGAGLDAAITQAYQESAWGVRGVPGYVIASLRSLATYGSVPLRLELDGKTLELDVLLVAVGNGGFYGKGIRIVPPASPSDGLLDVCVVLAAGLAEISSLVALLLVGRHTGHPRVRTFQAKEVILRAAPGLQRAVRVHADGDLVGELPVRFSVLPGGISVFRPGAGRSEQGCPFPPWET
jgi:diacylglycerol kinase (ATP)